MSDEPPDRQEGDEPSRVEEAARRLDPLKAAREKAEREAAAGRPLQPPPEPKRIEADRTQVDPPRAEPARDEAAHEADSAEADRADAARARAAGYDLSNRLGPTGRAITPVVDVRKYQRRIAMFGIGVLVLISLVVFVERGVNTPGVGPGQRLHEFVAPLATSGITLPANADPHCNPAKPQAHGLNMCNRRPIVLAFFVTGDGDCTRQVDTLQRIASQFPGIEFAALAAGGNVHDTRALVRSHHWTIPVGTDPDGRVGALYGVEFCPMVEIARKGGIVAQRLIGDGWSDPAKLATEVRKYLG